MNRRLGFILVLALIQITADSCIEEKADCTDPMANNYNSAATINNGSCTYNSHSVSPVRSMELSEKLAETSSLVIWNSYGWTTNDSGDPMLYGIDLSTGEIEQEYPLSQRLGADWEEIDQDGEYLYLGDIGNNTTGVRQDLHILRIEKTSILAGNPVIDTIWYSYSNQVDLSQSGEEMTDFDCEAFIVSSDSIYLFSKQWVSAKTTVYSLPKFPGTYIAKKMASYNVEGLVTGATYLEQEKLLVLCGYSMLLDPFLYLFYDFPGQNFFTGNKRKLSTSLSFHQIEGIASIDGLAFYLTNESLNLQQLIQIPQKMHFFDLTDLLGKYVENSGQ